MILRRGLKLIYLVLTREFSWLRLAGRDSAAKDVEILMLRHQLAVAQRRDPRLVRKLTWADRAWLALLAGVLPHGRLSRVRLIVAPATLLHWHRDLLRRRWALRSRRRPGRPPDNVIDLEEFRVRRRDRVGGLLPEPQDSVARRNPRPP